MDFTGISPEKAGFSQLQISQNLPEDKNLLDIGKEKIDSLKKSIYEIKNLITERESLRDSFVKDSEDLKMELNNFILENENSPKTELDAGDFSREKNSLRNKKIELSELQLKERIDCWKDVALLKKELRQSEQEFNEKQDRLNSLNKFLEEN